MEKHAATGHIPRGKDYIFSVLTIGSIGSASNFEQKHGLQSLTL